VIFAARRDDETGACDPAGVRPQADVKNVSCGYRRCVSTQWQAAPPSRPRRPPLSKRLRPRHWIALDVLAAVPCALLCFLSIARTMLGIHLLFPLMWDLLAALLALLLSAPVALRRRAPLGALVAATAGAVLVTLIALSVNNGLSVAGVLTRAPAFMTPVAYVIYLVAARYRRRTAVLALAVELGLLVVVGVAGVAEPGNSQGLGIFIGLVIIIFWGAGYGAGQRRAYAEQLQQQAASSAVTEERLRIARELHDVVAHSMTVVAVQAGYGLHVIDGQPAKAGEALGAIQATSREALADMRRMLGVLRHGGMAPFSANKGADGHGAANARENGGSAGTTGTRETGSGPGAGIGGLRFSATAGDAGAGPGNGAGAAGGEGAVPLTPAPGLADLDRLVARMTHAGVRVELRIRGERRELPPGIDLAAFRIVQEALTNVVKHSGAATCGVIVSYEEDELSVEITDEGRGGQVPAGTGARGGPATDGGLPADGGGHGLIGMRERVSLYGGQLTAAPGPERGFRVAARLPIGEDLR
jgi:signal transduction histidine kinase